MDDIPIAAQLVALAILLAISGFFSIAPELIIFGGGVTAGAKRLIDDARLVMERRAMQASIAGLTIERARLGDDATLLGAAFVMDE